MNKLQKPLEVSPLIKFWRWSLLVSGIFYGINKVALYSAIEKRSKVFRDKKIEKLNAKKKEESDRNFTEVIKLFADVVDIKLPPDWKFVS